MTLSRNRAVRWLAVGAAVAILTTACGTPDSGSSGGSGGADHKGGTLTLLDQSDFEHLDPARNYVASQQHVAVLYAPTLTSYVNAAGVAGTAIAGDAATDTGTKNADASVWSFTIRQNLKWQDGKEVTCEDFLYGVKRSFSDILTDGPQYQKQYLLGGKNYKGVYLDPNGLPSVTCKGDTITYKLAQGVPDFNYTVSMGIFAAVRKDKDTKEKYDDQPFSYGPYMIKSHVRDQSLTLVRNKYWDQSLDKVRKNLPDEFDFKFGLDASVITDRLIQDKGADQATMTFGNTQVTAQQAQQVLNDPKLKARSVVGLDGFTWYIAVNTKKVPDQKCRQAYNYAMNKQTALTAFGGPAFGDIATSIIAPTLKAYKKADPYNLGSKPEGDPAMAKQLLAQSPTCQKNIKFDYSQTPDR
ncbi:ABC transporter substrate-binding protein [Fodinicola feengrottensis]|uniref:ABC transporter substrate-binding protein n=1 Tax=Fodinicola feengrottensis TaxID=435914 RepID=UPI0024417B1F|nr:ABC transporter substrate-binding protein [Fodinicola feengrottensis]